MVSKPSYLNWCHVNFLLFHIAITQSPLNWEGLVHQPSCSPPLWHWALKMCAGTLTLYYTLILIGDIRTREDSGCTAGSTVTGFLE